MDQKAAHVDGSGDCGGTHVWSEAFLVEGSCGSCQLKAMNNEEARSRG